MARELKQLMVDNDSTLDDVARAAYYTDSYIVVVVTPRGVFNTTQVAAEKFKEDGTVPTSREIWRGMWRGIRAVEQQHEWLTEEAPQGSEFDPPDLIRVDPRIAIHAIGETIKLSEPMMTDPASSGEQCGLCSDDASYWNDDGKPRCTTHRYE